MSVSKYAPKSVIPWVAAIVTSFAVFGSAQGAVIFEQGPDYHIIGYEAGGLPDGSSVAMVVLRVDIFWESGQLKVNTTIVDVLINDGWSYEIVKPGGVNSAVEVDIFNDTCSGTFKALYKPGKTVIDGGQIRCR